MTFIENKKAKIFIALLVVFFVAIGTVSVNASSLSDVNDQIDDARDDLAQGEEEIEDLNARITSLNNQIAAAEEDIRVLSAEITEAEAELERVTKELEIKQAEIDKKNEELGGRLRNMYKNGSLGFVDVLLSSSNVTDLFLNYDMVQMIYANDQDLMSALEDDYAIIEEELGKIEEIKAGLDEKKTELSAKEKELNSAKTALAEERSKISAENLELEKQIQDLQADADRLTAELAGSSGGSYTGGDLSWPTTTRWITSYFGPRKNPFGSGTTYHTGIDIGVGTGTPIYAANSGTVYHSGWYGGYGYTVIINHGGGMMTLYGHNSRLYVSKGEWVSRGEHIAGAGSTGNSTGPHLHFEVRVNGAYKNPLNYL